MPKKRIISQVGAKLLAAARLVSMSDSSNAESRDWVAPDSGGHPANHLHHR